MGKVMGIWLGKKPVVARLLAWSWEWLVWGGDGGCWGRGMTGYSNQITTHSSPSKTLQILMFMSVGQASFPTHFFPPLLSLFPSHSFIFFPTLLPFTTTTFPPCPSNLLLLWSFNILYPFHDSFPLTFTHPLFQSPFFLPLSSAQILVC